MIVISTKRFVLQWLCNDLLNVFIFRWANCKRHMSKPLTNSLCFIKDCWKSLTFVGINSRQILKQKIVTFFVINSLHLYLSKYKEIRLYKHEITKLHKYSSQIYVQKKQSAIIKKSGFPEVLSKRKFDHEPQLTTGLYQSCAIAIQICEEKNTGYKLNEHMLL